MEQLHAQSLLECRDRACYRGRRHAKPTRGCGEALFFGHANEYVHQLKAVHDYSIGSNNELCGSVILITSRHRHSVIQAAPMPASMSKRLIILGAIP
jgi:hypothetical protein